MWDDFTSLMIWGEVETGTLVKNETGEVFEVGEVFDWFRWLRDAKDGDHKVVECKDAIDHATWREGA